MKIIITSFLFLFFSLNFLQAQDWVTDIDIAKNLAAEKNLPIVLVFQGSDWCAACKKLDKEIWSTEEFQEYAHENYIMLLADFPKRKKNKLPKEQQAKNDNLAETYNLQGFFPLVVLLDKDGAVLGTTGYENIKPKAYIELLNSFLIK